MNRRLKFTYFFIIFLLLLLMARLAFIQILNGEEYSEAATAQQKVSLEGFDERGTIFDRNLKPLTGTRKDYVFIFEKEHVDAKVYKLVKAMKGRKIPSQNKKYIVFSCEKYDLAIAKNLAQEYNAFILETKKRYTKEQTAVHFIGYTNEIDQKGATGIEKDYEKYLTLRKKEVYGVIDATGRIIPGEGVDGNDENKDSGVVTTLDLHIQKRAEEILKESKYNGAIIVADVSTGGILAGASRPIYDPTGVVKYLDSPERAFINRTIQGLYPPGSVFKIVVASAALEEKIVSPESKFYCKGYEEINGIKINCSKKEGHGYINFQDAFAKSCNSVFIQVGQRLGGEKILNMAKRFQLNQLMLPDISNEKKGVLPEEKDVLGAGIGNLSIGQGTLLVTPMGVTRVTMIIANHGEDKGLYLIKGTRSGGKTLLMEEIKAVNVLDRAIADTMTSMMTETALTGTGRNLNILKAGKKVLPAVKTGSAETTMSGEYAVHGWLTGFLPAENPQYAITVFTEGGGADGNAAIPMFEKMAQYLLK